MFKAVIFDFDGVIADTMDDNFKAWEYAFSKQNVLIEKNDYFLLEGMGPKSIANYFINLNNLDRELLEEIILEKEKFYINKNHFKVYPEIYSIFNFLVEKKILIGIVTGASKDRFFGTLNKNIIDKTSVIVTSSDVVQTKPDPEPYITAVTKLNLKPNECLVVENAVLGIKSAKAAGCICYSVSTTLKKEFLTESDICFPTHSLLFKRLVNIF